MLNGQNRPAKRSTRALPKTKRPTPQRLSIGALPDMRGLLLVALVAAWLVGILLESLAALPFWPLLLAGAAGVVALLVYRHSPPTPMTRWLLLSLLLLACAAFGAARLALSSPVGDAAAVSAFIGQGPVTIRGEIAAAPVPRNRSVSLEIAASRLSLDNGRTWRDIHGAVAVIVAHPSGPYAPEYGDTVEVYGVLEPVVGSPLAVSTSLAQPSSSAAQPLQPVRAQAGVFAAMTFPRLVVVERGGGTAALAWLFGLRQRLAQAISQSLPEPEASLLIGILLGLKTNVLRSDYTLFQQSGTVHLLVASGFNVAVLSGLLGALARRLPGRRWSLALLLVGILGYVILSGAGPATVRAGIMGMLLVIAPRLGRAYNFSTALAFAVLLMSAWSPYVLWDVGFQLSVVAALGIALLTPELSGCLERLLGRLPAGGLSAELLAVTLAAQLATLPIQIVNFGQFSLIAPLTNLLVEPLFGALLALGALVGLLGLILPLIGVAAGWACWPLLWLVYQIIARSAALPFASAAIGPLDSGLAWLYELGLGLLVLWLRARPRTTAVLLTRAERRHNQRVRARWRLAGAALLVVTAGVTTLATLPDHRLHIIWLDVGPGGQAMLIQTPAGHTVLLDGGDDPAALAKALGHRLPFWQRTIDLVVLTNPRVGHLRGLIDALGHYQARQAVDAGMLHPSAAYASWRAMLEERGIPYRQLRQGATIQLEPGVTLQALAPGPVLSKDRQNEDTNALILRLIGPGLRVLFLGETSETALDRLTASSIDLRADIAQIALRPDQSVAESSARADLLAAVQPMLLVVTPASATTRSASHPAPAPPDTIRTLRVATTGALALIADSGRWWLES